MARDDTTYTLLVDPDAKYRVDGYAGIAWHYFGDETAPDDDTEWSGYEVPTGRVTMVMVGDDRRLLPELRSNRLQGVRGGARMSAHRLLHEDGGLHCYSCGAFFANPSGDEYSAETTRADDAAMRETAGAVPCTGPATEHPGYYLGMIDGEPYRETCATHPYAD